MLAALLLTVLILLYTFQSFFCGKFTSSFSGNPRLVTPIFNLVDAVAVLTVTLIVSGFSVRISLPTFLFGLVIAASSITYFKFFMLASVNGPYSILMVFALSFNIVVPTLVASIGFGDVLPLLKLFFILLVAASTYFVSKKVGETFVNKKKFFLSCLIVGLMNGLYGTVFDIQQRVCGEEERSGLLVVAFGVVGLFTLLTAFIREGKTYFTSFRQSGKAWVYLLTATLSAAIASNLFMTVLSMIDTALYFTFNNSGVFICSILMSVIFFKEKLSKTNLVGCAVMITGVVGVGLTQYFM